jgi:biopolymer transport protein ExbB/TolQ
MNEQIVKPVATAEVEKFLGLWEKYNALVLNHRWSSLERYGRDYIALIEMNDAIAEDVVNSLNPILELGEAMKLLGDDVAKAATEYQSLLYHYNRAVQDEAEKPRRDWEQARDEMIATFKKEERSLSIKLGKLGNKRWTGTEVEKAYIEEQYKLLNARKQIVELTLSDLQYMRYSEHEGTEFTMELVAEAVELRRERINHLIAEFGVAALQEVDA